MPFIRAHEATVYEIHGATFTSYARPAGGSRSLAAWRGELPPRLVAPAHTVSHEEVFYVLSGRPRLTIDGECADLVAGDAAVAPAGSTLSVENPLDEPARLWVTTEIGLSATLADGTVLTPPWANHPSGAQPRSAGSAA
ncbi:cupin [Kitasatospora sp. MMS16-BH015]|uniref:cupin domain-containing protein n=1 Tax=Kitasatospora sp. MMS16-BH015 TaxID=2018025 RepID=UPI000CA308F4|nr:cupin domain-containing protein [Kitasatospora sp. MMS16-BH015]AUG77561.1 cupin [Kitasatospora sp. MMS16-BH015]